jgi:hypothetical protein
MPVPKNLRGPNKYGGYRGDGGGAPGSAAIFPPGWGRGRDRRGRVPGRSHTSAGPAAAPRAPDRSPTTEPTISYASAGRLRAILVISMAYVCCGRVEGRLGMPWEGLEHVSQPVPPTGSLRPGARPGGCGNTLHRLSSPARHRRAAGGWRLAETSALARGCAARAGLTSAGK